MQLDADGKQDAEHQEGAEQLDPEGTVELVNKRFLFVYIFPPMPGAELGGGEVEALGKDSDAADGDDDEANPHGQPVFLFPEVRDVVIV